MRNATTSIKSGLASMTRFTNSGSLSDTGCQTGILWDKASSLTGDPVSLRPLPATLSVAVTTASGRYPASMSPAKAVAAKSGVPQKIYRMDVAIEVKTKIKAGFSIQIRV